MKSVLSVNWYQYFLIWWLAGKTKTYEEVEEMLEGGDPAIFTSDVSFKNAELFNCFFVIAITVE